MSVRPTWVLWLVILIYLLPRHAFAQTSEQDISAPPAPSWSAAAGSSATPDGACRLSHQRFNPGAPYSPPTYASDTSYACHWLARQHGGPPEAGTVLPNMAYMGCPFGYERTNGTCTNGQTDSTLCDCDDPARGVAAPPTPFVGNPVSVTTGFKVQDELDYSTADGLFRIKRRHVSTKYRAWPVPQVGFGESWQGLIPGRLHIPGSSLVDVLWLTGNGESFHKFVAPSSDNNSWNFTSNAGTRGKLTMVTTPTVSRTAYFNEPAIVNGPPEFRLQFGSGEYILFRRAKARPDDRDAVPIERGYANGYKQYFDYADDGLFPYRVRDSFGRELLLSWVDTPRDVYNPEGADPTLKAIGSILLPDGTMLSYQYEQANYQATGAWTDTYGLVETISVPGRKDRLKEVRRTNAAGDTIWKRAYFYEDMRWPYSLTGIKDQDGLRLSTYSYNGSGLIASSERAGGVDRHEFRQYQLKTGSTVDEGHLYHEVTNPLGRKETYKLYQNGNWKPAYLPRSIRWKIGEATANIPVDQISVSMADEPFNAMVSSIVDKKGVTTSYGLDGVNRRPTSITEAQGTSQARTTTIAWHPLFDWPTRIERPGLRVEHSYSAIGQMVTRTETDTTTQSVPYSTAGQTRTWTYTWEPSGRLGSINGPRLIDAQGKDDISTFTYDAAGNLLSATNGLGHVTSFAGYDPNGLAGSMSNANGVVTEFSYDALGRATAIRVKHPSDGQLDALTEFEYDLESRVVGVTQPATEKLTIDYNAGGQLTAIRTATGERIDFTSDAMGNVTATTVKRTDGSAARSVARTFDELGRMLTETLGPGRTVRWAYDKNGNAVQTVSARSYATQDAFDPLNRLVSTVAPDNGTASTVYNVHDQVISSTDAIAVQTTFVRNGFGEVIQEVSPDRGTSTHYYNEAGELTATIDGRGQRIDYARDIVGRVTEKVPVGRPMSETMAYTWDVPGISGSYGVGRLSSVTDGTGTTSFAYDHRGNLVTKRQGIGTAIADLAYQHDLADRITQITYPSGRLVAYDRDSKGRVAQVRTKNSPADPNWTTLVGTIAYEPWGSVTAAEFGNGLALSQVWNGGRLASKRLWNPSSGANRSWLGYAYDGNDNVGAIRDELDGANSVHFGYDTNDRISFASMTIGTPANDSETYSYVAGKNQLASVTNSVGTRSIAYDGRGNTLSEARPGGGSVAVAYDGHGRLLTYDRTGDPGQWNAYNGLDDRVAVTVNGETRRFVFDADGRVIGEYGSSASEVIAETIWLQPEVANDNQPIGGDDGVGGYAPLAIATGSGASTVLTWVHGNHLGVPIAFTDAGGSAVPMPAGITPVGFPGQMRTLPDLYYNRHRDYDSSTGRYIQADPIGLEGGSNPYLYAEGNPLRFVDPLGLEAAFFKVGDIIRWDATHRDPTDRMPHKWAAYGALAMVGGAYDLYKFCADGQDDAGNDDDCYKEWMKEQERCRDKFPPGIGQLRACLDRARKNYRRCLDDEPYMNMWNDDDMDPKSIPRRPFKRSQQR